MGYFVLLLSTVFSVCACVCVFKPTGDMLYFEVINLFNCVSIFWNGIISSLKHFLKSNLPRLNSFHFSRYSYDLLT